MNLLNRLHQRHNTTLFLVSFLTLFLEMSLIRWISTEIRIFAYVNNLVLLACFLGIGVGCYYATRRANLALTLFTLTALLVLVTAPLAITFQGRSVHLFKELPTMLSVFSDFHIWFEEAPESIWLKSLVGLASTLVIFSLIVMIFIPLGQVLGKLFTEYENVLFAYSLNVVASLVGIWCFNALSFMFLPPAVWFFVVWLAVALLARRSNSNTVFMTGVLAACLAMLLVMALRPVVKQETVVWSPYQKLQVHPIRPPLSRAMGEGLTVTRTMDRGFMVRVNDVAYMLLLDLSDRFFNRWPDVFDVQLRQFSQYDIPYLFKPDAEEVLIVGAGGGNDVAGAIRNGAKHITAVEIDPGIYRLGLALHPETPYTRPNVTIVIDDARSFFKHTEARYDVISFGLLDAHTQASTYNNMRIDHYVYTEESFREARNLLKERGVLTVIFEVQRPWIAGRIAGLLRKTFGADPIVFWNRSEGAVGWGGLMFVVSNDMTQLKQTVTQQKPLERFLADRLVRPSAGVKLTTDNWPYLYLEHPRIPSLHLCLSGILVVLFLIFRKWTMPKGRRLNWHFFFLGAAFLLLEFQNISKTTLLFGSTWLVNAFTISAILSLILLANLLSARWKTINIQAVYAALVISVSALCVIPLNVFNALPYLLRGLVSSVVLNIPILFAGIIFITSFKKAKQTDIAFGSNLLGAGVGGIVESLSFVTGINMLLIVVAVLYLASLAFLEK